MGSMQHVFGDFVLAGTDLTNSLFTPAHFPVFTPVMRHALCDSAGKQSVVFGMIPTKWSLFTSFISVTTLPTVTERHQTQIYASRMMLHRWAKTASVAISSLFRPSATESGRRYRVMYVSFSSSLWCRPSPARTPLWAWTPLVWPGITESYDGITWSRDGSWGALGLYVDEAYLFLSPPPLNRIAFSPIFLDSLLLTRPEVRGPQLYNGLSTDLRISTCHASECWSQFTQEAQADLKNWPAKCKFFVGVLCL